MLIGREEADRVAVLYQPKDTGSPIQTLSLAMLEEIEALHTRVAGAALPMDAGSFRQHPLGWAAAHLRARLADPAWTALGIGDDFVAAAVIGAFWDFCHTWGHHPLFGAMVDTAAVAGFSFHALAPFAAARALALPGNHVGFETTGGPKPQVKFVRVAMADQEPLLVATRGLPRFEWPNDAQPEARTLLSDVTKAMDGVQGFINRLHPGLLILSPGASDYDRMLGEAMGAAVRAQGKRHRGLAGVAFISPKVTAGPNLQFRFGHSFFPVANEALEIGRAIKVGPRPKG